MEPLDQHLDRVARIVDRLSIIVKGLRAAAFGFSGLAVVGGLLAWIGIWRSPLPWWVGIIPGLILCFPALGLWRLRLSLVPSLSIGDQLRGLPSDVKDIGEDLGRFGDALGQVKASPRSPRAFIRAAKGTKSAVDVFLDTNAGRMVQGTMALHPALLMLGATSAMFATGSFVLGGFIFFLSGL